MQSAMQKLLSVFMFMSLLACSSDDRFSWKEAQSSYQAGKYRTAVIQLKKVLKNKPDHAQARLLLGDIYLKVGDGASAEKEFSHYKKYTGDATGIVVRLTRSWLQQAQYKKVMTAAKNHALTDLGDRANMQVLLGDALYGLKKYDEAGKAYRQAINLSAGHVGATIGQARLNQLNNEGGKAIVALKKLVEKYNGNAEIWYELGNAYSQNALSDNAIKAYQNAVRIYDQGSYGLNDFVARVALVSEMLKLNKLEELKPNLARLMELYPSHPIAQYTDALVAYSNKQYDQAEDQLLQVINRLNNYMPAYLVLGSVYFAKGNYELANEHLSRFVHSVPSHIHARKLLASIRVKLNRKQEALEVLTGIEHSKQDQEILGMIGQLAISSGRLDLATKSLEQYIQADRSNAQVQTALAMVYLSQGEYDQVIESIQQLSQSEQDRAALLLVDAYLRKGEFDKARNRLEALLEKTPAEPMLLTAIAVVELHAGKRDKAKKLLLDVVKQHAAFQSAKIYLARILMEDGQLAASEKLLNAVLSAEPKNTRAMLTIAQIAEQQGRQGEAVSWLKKANKANPKAVLPPLLLAHIYLNNRQAEKALQVLEDNASHHGSNIRFLRLLARVYADLNRFRDAEKIYQDIVKKYSRFQVASLELAAIQIKQKSYLQARKTLEALLKRNPKSVLAKNALGVFELNQGNISDAVAIAREIIKGHKYTDVGYRLLGDIYLKQEKYKQAQANYEKAQAMRPNHKTLFRLFRTYYLIGQQSSARKVLQNWLYKRPGDIKVMFSLGRLYEQQGENEDAMKMYKNILRIAKTHVASLNNIANILMSQKNYPEALEYARKAYQAGSAHPLVVDTYGWALVKNGDIEKGYVYLSQAAKLTGHPSVQYHLAYAMSRVGRPEQAIKILRSVLAKREEFPEKAEARKLLGSLQ